MVGSEITRMAKSELAELTGLKPDTVSGMKHDDQGWHITLEMIELKRIPESNDVLATYELLLDETGTILNYQRVRRYTRSQVNN